MFMLLKPERPNLEHQHLRLSSRKVCQPSSPGHLVGLERYNLKYEIDELSNLKNWQHAHPIVHCLCHYSDHSIVLALVALPDSCP